MGKPILCVDFDGVIHSYASGWQGALVIPDPPVPGAIRWLLKASEWWDVQIYSSRTKEPGAVEAMQEWLAGHAEAEFQDAAFARGEFMRMISFPAQKPAANMTIDDRALCFEGNWDAIDPQTLLDFKPWTKRPAPVEQTIGNVIAGIEARVRPTIGPTFNVARGVETVEGRISHADYTTLMDLLRLRFYGSTGQ